MATNQEFDMDTFSFPWRMKNSIDRLKYIVKKLGDTPDVNYKGKKIPLIIRIKETSEGLVLGKININTPQTSDMVFQTLSIIIGTSYPFSNRTTLSINNDAHIAYVNANKQLKMSGTFIITFALAVLRFLGVHMATLQDAAQVSLPDGKNSSCPGFLSVLKMYQKRETFYSKFGFKPMVSSSLHDDFMFTSNADKRKKLCQWAKDIQQIKMGEIVAYLRPLINELANDKTPVVVRTIETDDGVRFIDEKKRLITENTITKLKQALRAFAKLAPSLTVGQYQSNITACKEQQKLSLYLSETALEYRFSNGIILKNPHFTAIKHLHDYLLNNNYKIDLTSKVTPMCES